MKHAAAKRMTAVLLSAALAAGGTLAVQAAPLKKDPPAGYITALPQPTDHGVLIYEDFEKALGDATGRMGKFTATVPEDQGIDPPTVEITDEAAFNGTRSLKVSNRGTDREGNPMGYNTLNYENIALDIANFFVKDPDNRNKTDTYYFSAWVRNVDPTITQYFWVQLQYGGSGEVWFPDDTYFEVSGDEWTLIGGEIRNGQIYYMPFVEDSTGSGVSPGRTGMTSWSGMKLVTRNPLEEGQEMVQTNGDFYIDDIVFWRANDTSDCIQTLPEDDGKEYPDPKPSMTPADNSDDDTVLESSGNTTQGETTTPSANEQTQQEQSGGTDGGVAGNGWIGILIGVGAVVVVGLVAAVVMVLVRKRRR